MKEMKPYRHELKYQISYTEYMELRQRLRTIMQLDPNAQPNGRYSIHSVYFDNLADKALREKLYGIRKREKFRIRYYNNDFSYIILEKKLKNNNLCLKLDAQLSEDECRAILNGNIDWMLTHPAALVRELYCKMKGQQLRPRVLVSYNREPYIYPPGNVRITFDSQIRTTLFHQSFLEEQVQDISVMDAPGDKILEVKYNAFLPSIIACLLQTGRIRQQAYSKYGACRRFG